jgi:fucose 4-O-acetylase-like acetyltransferase
VFLNRFTAKLTEAQFMSLILTVLAVTQFSWSGQLLENLAYELRDTMIGIFFFLMGGYIAKYNPFKNLKAFTLLLIIAAAFGIRFLSAYNFVAGSIDEFIKSNSVEPFIPRIQKRWNYEIAVVIIVISLFDLFRRLRVPKNAVINYIGKATLVIYFIHENSFFQMFYKDINWLEILSESVLLYCLKWLKWTAIAFAVGLAAYCLYTLLGKLLPRIRSWFVVQEPGE